MKSQNQTKKGYILLNFIYITFWKGKAIGMEIRSMVPGMGWEKIDSKWRNSGGQENSLWFVMMLT